MFVCVFLIYFFEFFDLDNSTFYILTKIFPQDRNSCQIFVIYQYLFLYIFSIYAIRLHILSIIFPTCVVFLLVLMCDVKKMSVFSVRILIASFGRYL